MPSPIILAVMSRKKMQQQLFEADRQQELQQALQQRAAGAGAQDQGKDVHGILPFIFKAEDDAGGVTGRAGLPLVVEVFRGLGGHELVETHLQLKKRRRGYPEAELVEDLLLLQCAGGEHLEDLSVLGDDEGLCRLLDRTLPSPDAARDFLLRFHDEALIDAAKKAAEAAGEASYVPQESESLSALSRVQAELMRRMADADLDTTATLDHDATIIESHKQTATWHYKKGTGYQPAAVVWAEQGLVVADEFRDGNVPAGKDNLRLIRRAFCALPDWVTQRRFRADSACYEEKVLKWLANPERPDGPRGEIAFTISADLTPELRAECLEVKEVEPGAGAVREAGADTDAEPELYRWHLLDDTRAHEVAHWSEVVFVPGVWPKDTDPLRYLVVRLQRRQGALFASGEPYKYLAVVTNRQGAGDELLRWHWKKAGTIEHVHDETKNGLGAGVLPCWEFGANAAWYRLSMMAYNIMTMVKRLTLPPQQQTAKAKRVRFLVFDVAARITSHARYLYAHVKGAVLERATLLDARRWLRVRHRRRRWSLTPAPAG